MARRDHRSGVLPVVLAFATFAQLNLLAVGAHFLLRDERARYTAAHDG
jgi:hypothetical protein